MIRPLLALVPALVVAVAGVTILALEGQEVVVLRTHLPDGSWRETRVWVADEGGVEWIEAGNPEREFYADLGRDPSAELVRRGSAQAVVARPHPGAEGHEKIRSLLRAKYGCADWWIGRLVDTSRSIAVQLDPAPRSS